MTIELEQKVDLMKREVDALQIAMSERKKPWFKNVSTLLSIIALLFSFGTTFVSYRRTENQDVEGTRQELRGLLQRLAALPKENVDIRIKYANDPGSMNIVGGLINQENELLARQAAELTNKLPVNLVSSTEYYAIALALQNSYDLSGAESFLKKSADKAKVLKDFNTEIAAIRTTANLQFMRGRPESGRVGYQTALNIFSEYPGYDPFTKSSTNIATELAWAYSEANIGSHSLAKQHLDNATTLLNTLPNGPGTAVLAAQVKQATLQLDSSRTGNSPAVDPNLGINPLSGFN